VTVQILPQVHEWRQQLDLVRLDIDPDGPPMIGPAGYYCTRCLSMSNADGQLIRWLGDQEEMAAFREATGQEATA
jgi:hypothetical protein